MRQAEGAWHRLLRWRDSHPLLSLYLVGVFSRVLVLAATALGGLLLPHFPYERAWTADAPTWLGHLARWDAAFYLESAERGRVRPELWTFGVGYPLAIRGVATLVPPLGLLGAGFVVGLAAFAAAIPLFYHLGLRWFDRRTAWRATALFAILPASFYFTAIYPDGLFVALLLGALLALGHRWWLVGGALASLAGVVRPQGIVLPGVVLLAALLERARSGRWSVAALAAVPLAAALPLLDVALAWQATGDPLYAHHVRSATWPQVSWRNPLFTFFWDLAYPQQGIVRASLVLLLAAGVWGLRDAKRRRHDAPVEVHAWTLGMALVGLAYSDPAAMTRYLLPVVGAAWMLGEWARGPWRFGLVALLALAALLTTAAQFAAWYPYY